MPYVHTYSKYAYIYIYMDMYMSLYVDRTRAFFCSARCMWSPPPLKPMMPSPASEAARRRFPAYRQTGS